MPRINMLQSISRVFIICFALMLAVPATTFAQDNVDLKLAREFFRKGEYEKSRVLYKKLFSKNASNSYYYRNYLQCLVALEDYETAEKLIQKQIKKNKKNPSYLIDKGYLLVQQDQLEAGKKEYEKAIGQIKSNPKLTRTIASTFITLGENSFVIAAYEEGQRLDPNTDYSNDLARAYKKDGNYEKMIENYITYAGRNPVRVQVVKNEFQRILKQEEFNEEIQKQLYRKIQSEPNQIIYPELLTWVFVQNKDFDSAFVQVKALDMRMNEGGTRVYDLAQTASIENQYDAAIGAYNYVIGLGKQNNLYQLARVGLVRVKKNKLTAGYDFSESELQVLEADYLELLNEFGRVPGTVKPMRDLSHLYAFYLHDLDKASQILESIVEMPGVGAKDKALCKLDLGDFYVLSDEIWDATLYYSQVDKDFKEDYLGELARFKNAKLSYYNGDFDWAQTQLSILKASTSELISNDALDLSIFIIDNLGLDTTAVTMQKFAQADLYTFQNKFDLAFNLLDSLDAAYPGHTLTDDILYRRAEIETKRKDFTKAAEYYQQIIDDFPTDILADNAMFFLGELNEDYFDNKELAMQFYRTLMIEYPGSLYTVEARKRFRKLRGDDFN